MPKPEPAEPEIAPDVQAAHEAKTDEALDAIFGDEPDEEDDALPQEAEEEAFEEEDEGPEVPDGIVDAPAGPIEEAPEAEEEEQPYDAEHRHKAWLALKRDGWSEEEIDSLPEQTMVARGLSRLELQTENDRAYSERDELSKLLREQKPTDTAEGQVAGVGHPEQGAEHPAKTGADLTEAALPVAQKLAEMDDPKEVAAELASFVAKAIESVAPQPQPVEDPLREELLVDAVQRRLGPDFEGDLEKLLPVAATLGNAGLHGDLKGLSKAVALVQAAQRLSGGPTKKRTNSSTSRARKRGSAPPVSGRKTPPRKKTAEDILNDKILSIQRGNRDVEELRGMG